MPAFEWTEARFEIAKTMWSAGVSATIIAYDLGCSRNAVIGKMHRNGLTKNPPRSKAKASKPKPAKVTAPRAVLERIRQAAVRAAEAPIIATPAPTANTKTLMELGPTDCRWPIGEPSHPDFRFCGGLIAFEGCPYCAGHARKAYVLPRRLTPKGGTDGEAYRPKTNGFNEEALGREA